MKIYINLQHSHTILQQVQNHCIFQLIKYMGLLKFMIKSLIIAIVIKFVIRLNIL